MYTFGDLDLRWIGNRKWKLLKDVFVYLQGEIYLSVARGLVTDLASIPIIVRSLLNKNTHLAAVVHDYGYQHDGRYIGHPQRTRKEVDVLFYDLLRASGVGGFRARSLYWGVRAGAWNAWRKYNA